MRSRLRLFVLASAALASVATSAPRFPRNYPQWQVTGERPAAERQVGCATAAVWVAKSAKTGLGVTLRLTKQEAGDTPTPCVVAVTRARLVVGTTLVDSPAPAPIDLPALSQVEHRYLPFEFDNNAAWNRGERTGTLTLGFADGSEWSIPMTHAWSGPHGDRQR